MSARIDHRLAILFHIRRFMPRPLGDFLVAEAAGAVVLLLATALALLWANTTWFGDYTASWTPAREFINEGLMTIFFLVVGLEIKREVVKGELHDRRAALLPAVAAVGGMIVPALIYFMLNRSGPGAVGWAIPVATDIVFAAAVLTLLGKWVPSSLKLFLLVLAVVDDIGAIVVIGVFYSGQISVGFLALGGVVLALAVALQRVAKYGVMTFLALTFLLWLTLHGAGMQASIAGAIMGLCTPFKTPSLGGLSVGERLEMLLYPVATFLVIPVFALANAGVVLSGVAFGDPAARMVALGIFAGLILGKLIGITLSSWLVVRAGWAKLPRAANWRQMMGLACVAGIGFTVALFVADLSFSDEPALQAAAKLSILVTSLTAAMIGALLLRSAGPKAPADLL